MIKSWSMSRLKEFEECPYRALLLYGPNKLPVQSSQERDEILARGTEWHGWAENFVLGKIALPEGLLPYKNLLSEYRDTIEMYPKHTWVETKWCLDNDLIYRLL